MLCSILFDCIETVDSVKVENRPLSYHDLEKWNLIYIHKKLFVFTRQTP